MRWIALAEEMGIDLYPFENFSDFRVCQTSWDYDRDYQIVAEQLEQQRLMEEAEEMGIMESDISFLADNLRNLQYDYIVARLQLKGNLEFYRFMLKMAECLNQKPVS